MLGGGAPAPPRRVPTPPVTHNNRCNNNNLRELFYCRNPGDAREGRVGSGGRVVAQAAKSGVGQIGVYYILFCAGDPPKLALLWGN